MAERVRPSTDVAWVDGGDRVVALRLDDLAAEPMMLEASAADVWRAMGEGAAVEEIVAEVAAAYDVPTDAVAVDVRVFLDHAVDVGLVVRADG